MKILTVCSGFDFINYTRRATIEAIHKVNPDLDILLFNSVLNLRKSKKTSVHIQFYFHHFWVVETLRKIRLPVLFEHFIRYIKWHSFFKRYDVIFFIDPNQYYLLPYLNKKQKLVYLLRDPSILQDPDNYKKELPIINRADLILGISKSLCSYYFKKYYKFIPGNVKLWPNTVDLSLWNYNKLKFRIKQKPKPIIGLAGNINNVIDLELILFIVSNLPEYDFEIAGKLNLNKTETEVWTIITGYSNFKYLGFIEYNKFPETVINWDVGLVAAKQDHEYANYLNNNKQYQYMALGKPFVTFCFDADYSEFGDMVFIANSKPEYLEKIKQAYMKSAETGAIEEGIKIAQKNSAEMRAKSFIKFLSK